MTQIFNDNVEVTLTIDGDPWRVKDAEVELSRMDTPNYADLLMVPDPDETALDLPTPIDKLIGSDFRLEADNTLISERATDAEEDNLLFDGLLANISATGRNVYEGIAYDPGQQPFAIGEDDDGEQTAETEAAAGGSIMNDKIVINQAEYDYDIMFNATSGVTFEEQTIQASELVERAVEKVGIDEYEIDLREGGITVEGQNGSYTGGFERTFVFADNLIPVREALNKAREWCKAEWWFDKEGVFHFGVPRPTRHELRFITDADAGKTTPPYQSVRVIGSGAASAEGYARTSMEIEDKIVVEAEIALDENRDATPNFVTPGEGKQPRFDYHNLEVSTDAQARATVTKLIEDLAEQQADGSVTVVGFPEIVPMDGIVMPSGEEGDYPEDDIRNAQPMGGLGYNVYKVTHRLNSSDGFITKIQVAGVTGVTKTVVSSEQASTTYDVTSINHNIGDLSRGRGATEVR